jgi:molybdopterin converting factor small subunit
MRVIVRLPAMLHDKAAAEVVIEEPVHDIAGVREALERKFPALAATLGDPLFNVAVNDVMLLHGVRQYPVKDGDVVEVIPTVAGGREGTKD